MLDGFEQTALSVNINTVNLLSHQYLPLPNTAELAVMGAPSIWNPKGRHRFWINALRISINHYDASDVLDLFWINFFMPGQVNKRPSFVWDSLIVREWWHSEPSISRIDMVPRQPFCLQLSHPISPHCPSLLASPQALLPVPAPSSQARKPHLPQQSPSWQCCMCPALRTMLCPKTTALGTLWDKSYSMLPVTSKSWSEDQHTFC